MLLLPSKQASNIFQLVPSTDNTGWRERVKVSNKNCQITENIGKYEQSMPVKIPHDSDS